MSTSTLPVLTVGLRHCERIVVAPSHTVPQVDPSWPGFKEMPPVLATALMIGFVEQTCVMALHPFLSAQQRTVGTHVDITHTAPTAVGMEISAEIELVEINGKSLSFKVRCLDNRGLIGAGTHQRAIIDLGRFMERLHDRATRAV